MLHPNDPLNVGVTDEELAWCRSRRHIAEANAVIRCYEAKFKGDTISRNDSDLSRAVWNLRLLRGREPIRLNHLYAYLTVIPGAGENIAAYMEDRQGNMPTCMIAGDVARLRNFRDAVRLIENQGDTLSLVRFDRGPVLQPHDLWDMPSSTDRVEMLFAVLHERETGDEGIAPLHTPHAGIQPIVLGRKEELLQVLPYVKAYADLGQRVEIRGYVNRTPFELPV